MKVVALFIPAYVHTAVKTMAQIQGDRPVHVKKIAACRATAESGEVGGNRDHYYPDTEKHPGNAIRLAEMEYQPHHGDVNRHHKPQKQATPAQGAHLCSEVPFFLHNPAYI